MNLELPSGLTARPATPDDVAVITELVAVCERADDGVAEIDEHDIAVAFGRHGFDPALYMVLVFDGEELVGWGDLYRGRGEGDVRPSHRERGIGTALLGWMEDQARSQGEAEVRQPKTDANAGARQLFSARGYEPSWASWIIRISLDAPTTPPVPPNGISIRPYDPSDDRAVHEVIDAAFCEWPGRDPEPFEVWAPQVVEHPAFAPELSPLAFDGNELIGSVIAFDYPEIGEGWIQQLATKATHRRRGIAQALLRTAFGWFGKQGRRVAGVSTDSRTGALGLYEKVGMRVVRQYTSYRKPLG